MTTFQKGDRVRLKQAEGTVTGVGVRGLDLAFDDGARLYALFNYVEKVIPEAPPRGSLVQIGLITYYVLPSGKLSRIYSDGSMHYDDSRSHHAAEHKEWADVYRPGYKVASFS